MLNDQQFLISNKSSNNIRSLMRDALYKLLGLRSGTTYPRMAKYRQHSMRTPNLENPTHSYHLEPCLLGSPTQ